MNDNAESRSQAPPPIAPVALGTPMPPPIPVPPLMHAPSPMPISMPMSHPLPPVMPQVLSYAMPYAPLMGGVWREGQLIVVPTQAELPDVCVKCGEPAGGWRWRKKLYWHHPALYLLIIFPGLLIYVIVALCVRKKATVGVGLCRAHRSRRIKWILATTMLALGGLVVLFGGIAMAAGARSSQAEYGVLLVLAALVMLILAAVAGLRGTRVLQPRRIDGPWAWYIGGGEGFLRGLPAAGQV
jgi:hypothetical protein